MRDDWTATTLGEVVVINPEAARGMADDDEIVYVDLSSVSAESGISSDLYRGSFGEAPGRARRVIRTQDVLVSTVRPYLRGFALVPDFLDGEIASTGFAVLRAKPSRILPGLVWAIVGTNNFVDYLMDRATGSSYPAVRPEDVASFSFSLPPHEEQKRIVDVVSSVDNYIDALQKQADRARTARNAVLHELLSAGGDDWTATTLGEVVVINPEVARGMADDDEIVYVDLSSVSAESGISSDLYRGSFGEAPGRARRVIRTQDVLVSTVRPYLRGFALVPDFLDGEIASTGFAVLRAKPSRILPGLVWAIVGTNNFVDYLMDRATGSSYPAVRPEDVASFSFSLPPLAEQKRIVEIVSSMDDVVQSTEQAITDAKILRSGLLSDLLSGEHEIPASYDSLLGAA